MMSIIGSNISSSAMDTPIAVIFVMLFGWSIRNLVSVMKLGLVLIVVVSEFVVAESML